MSFASAATSMSPMPAVRHEPRRIGLVDRAGRASCATLASPPRTPQVGAVVCVHARDMKEPWCLAASDTETPAGTLIKQYARRWTIDIDQAWRLSRIKQWLGSTCNETFWVEHRGS